MNTVAPSMFKFSVNTRGKNKDWDFHQLSSHFQDQSGTLADVIEHVQAGHALCAGLLNGQWRKKTNFAGSQWILSEIDNSTVLKDEQGQVVKGPDGKAIKVYDPQMTLADALA
ncbi:MAG: hypothetical protein SFW36_04475, partial [Leptolyngbyaceae cyanobacterium bins.59]|nr:hypothetical protein [Leptolyngbyaceae cyanobacterium bins.59]